jgi:hypothetical protein
MIYKVVTKQNLHKSINRIFELVMPWPVTVSKLCIKTSNIRKFKTVGIRFLYV